MVWPNFTAACRADIDRVLRSGKLTAYRANAQVGVGPTKDSQAWRLEREIEKKFKVRHAIAVSSGTAALHAALVAADIRGREVVTSPYTFSATASAIILAGGVPRFADVDPHTFCITKETVKRVITKRTAAIMPVHLFGYFPDLSDLRGLGLPIVEDACQAVGASRNGVYAGTHGLAGAYSFNGSKNLPTGEGGCLVTNSDEIAEKARRFINHAENFEAARGLRTLRRSPVDGVGLNYRMHELVAVLARHGLRELDKRNERRRALAEIVYRNVDSENYWKYVVGGMHPAHVYYVTPFTVKSGTRPRFIRRCARRGLQVGAGYIQPPLHHYPAFRRFADRPLPVVDELSFKTLCILSNLTPDKPISEARRTARVIRESLE